MDRDYKYDLLVLELLMNILKACTGAGVRTCDSNRVGKEYMLMCGDLKRAINDQAERRGVSVY